MSTTSDIHELSTADGRLTLRFDWSNDRFAHRVTMRRSGKHVEAPEPESEFLHLTSIEGGSTDDFPPSPAIQQLSSEVIEGRQMILGVGGSGTSHFSVSIQVVEQDRTSRTGLQSDGLHFDWAVRLSKSGVDQVREMAQRGLAPLGSGYLGSRAVSIGAHAPSTLVDVPDLADGARRVVAPIDLGARTVQWSYFIGAL
ncbi:MAG: hypothetical protein AAGC97_19205 [Planctomycetota bacterium]